jgi:hypothetical protein
MAWRDGWVGGMVWEGGGERIRAEGGKEMAVQLFRGVVNDLGGHRGGVAP